ncbi:hypothetical protein VNO80_18401 [Phaseolus coccineus]|uniref:Uncharacterized protein n=1 Tax=Phaseolus coccineus TaxID=3886 RepID=A0AAN9QZI4_PHACN
MKCRVDVDTCRKELEQLRGRTLGDEQNGGATSNLEHDAVLMDVQCKISEVDNMALVDTCLLIPRIPSSSTDIKTKVSEICRQN